MPRRYDLSTVRARCKKRADMENDSHISDSEWNALISEQYGELYEIVAGTGLRYFETTLAITADGSNSYDEPDDHGKTMGLDRIETDGTRVRLRPLMVQERSFFNNSTTGVACEYAIIDNQIFLYPRPASGSYQLLYIPQPPDISSYADTDEIDTVCIFGEGFLIWGVALKALSKSESDVRLAIQERDRMAQRLMEWAAERDATEPRRRIYDTEYEDGMYPFDPAGWGNRPR